MQPECFAFIILFTFVHCEMEGFIVGGSFTTIKRHPYSALIKVKCVTIRDTRSVFTCGASIVNQRILLTAGHCLETCITASHVGIYVGHEQRDRGTAYSAHSFVVHEEYNSKISSNDIALVRVQTQLRLGSKVSRVALMKNPPYTEKALVAGWGITDEVRLTQTDRLKVMSQHVWGRGDCLRLFGTMPDGTICASSANVDEYAAQGDSGSALVVRGYIQIGLVSYKVPSKSSNVIIYTDIGYFFNWIKSNAMRLYCADD